MAVVNFLSGPTSSAHPDTNAAISAPATLGGLGISLPAGTSGDAKLLSALAVADPGAVEAVLVDMPPVASYFFVPQVDEVSSSLAAAGGTGGLYTSTDPGELLVALKAVFQPVPGTSSSSSLVAGSFPSSAHVAADVGAQAPGDIYFALFQPGPGPRWNGNIKKLKLAPGGLITQALLSSPAQPAMSAEDGWILQDALTFWTDPLGADVLAFDPALGEVPGRDGRSVTRGGAGQQVPGFLQGVVVSSNSEPGARQLFTLDPSIPGGLIGVDATQAALAKLADVVDPGGLMSSDEQLALLRWVRGADSFDADGDSDRQEPRGWLLADPLHSRPLAIDYGARPGTAYSLANPDIRLFFGTNDGLFHMLRNTNEGGVDRESGRETWAFIPHGLLARQALLAQGGGDAGAGHAYGMDGEAVAHILDRDRDGNIEADEGDRVWVFVGQRRGGKELYAFDMTNPDQPRFKWMISNNTPGFDQLALTFSTPRMARLDLGGPAPVTVLVFAGGYNGGWNGGARVGKDAGAGPDLVGNAIFVVDADSGSLLWRAVGPDGGSAPEPSDQLHYVADLIHSIPSPVTVVDADHNGVDDRAYVGDSGGNVWRIEFTEIGRSESDAAVTAQSNWHLARIAALGGSGVSGRRFFHAPDVVQSRDADGDYTGVLILSGNRAAPRETLTRDFAYLLKDRWMAPAVSHAALADVTGICSATEADQCSAANLVQGWKLALQDPGEKGLSTPLVSNGVVYFTSYLPSAGGEASSCVSDQGASRVYAVSLADGSPGLPRARKLRLEEDEAPETEMETEPATDEEAVPRYRDIGTGLRGDLLPYRNSILVPGQGLDGVQLYGLPGRSRWRAYWREEEVDPL